MAKKLRKIPRLTKMTDKFYTIPRLAREHRQRVSAAWELVVLTPSVLGSLCVYFSFVLNMWFALGLQVGLTEHPDFWLFPVNFVGAWLRPVDMAAFVSVLCLWAMPGYAFREHYRRSCYIPMEKKHSKAWFLFFRFSLTDALSILPVHFFVVYALSMSEWGILLLRLPLEISGFLFFVLLCALTSLCMRAITLETVCWGLTLPHYFYKISSKLVGIQFLAHRETLAAYWAGILVGAFFTLVALACLRAVHGRITYTAEFVWAGYHQFFTFGFYVLLLNMSLKTCGDTTVIFFPTKYLIWGFTVLFLLYFICVVYSVLKYKELLYEKSELLGSYLNVVFEKEVSYVALVASFEVWRTPSIFEEQKFDWTMVNSQYKRLRHRVILYTFFYILIELYKYFP